MGLWESSHLCLRLGQSYANAGKWEDFSNVSKTIEKQGIKGILEYCAKGPIRVSSPMSKTRPNQDTEGYGGIVPMCSKPLRSKKVKEVCDMAPMDKWLLGNQIK